VIPDPEDDWDWGLPRAASAAKAISLGTSDDKSTRDEEPEGTINPVNIPVVRAELHGRLELYGLKNNVLALQRQR